MKIQGKTLESIRGNKKHYLVITNGKETVNVNVREKIYEKVIKIINEEPKK